MIWGVGFLRAMGVTMRNMFRPAITVQYPDERLVIPERARWALVHKYDEDGRPKCTACMICERECPDDIIHLTVSGDAASGKHIDEYRYELGACMMCGLIHHVPDHNRERAFAERQRAASSGPFA